MGDPEKARLLVEKDKIDKLLAAYANLPAGKANYAYGCLMFASNSTREVGQAVMD